MKLRDQLKEAQDRIYKAGGIVTLLCDVGSETVPAVHAVHHLLDEADSAIEQAIQSVDAPAGPEKSGTG